MRGNRRMIIGTGLWFAILIGCPAQARAEERKMCPICMKAGDQKASYSEKASYTLARGTTNTLFGWTELIRQPANEVKDGGNVFAGLGKGVGEAVKRTLGGAAELVTFWTPKVHDTYLHFSKDCPVCMNNKNTDDKEKK